MYGHDMAESKATTRRTFRIADTTWQAAKLKAEAQQTTVTSVLKAALDTYTEDSE